MALKKFMKLKPKKGAPGSGPVLGGAPAQSGTPATSAPQSQAAVKPIAKAPMRKSGGSMATKIMRRMMKGVAKSKTKQAVY